MPIIFLLYLVNYIDRTALGIANVNGMSEELSLTATMFGLASGIFFVGYILLEVPSAVIAQRLGARRWIARIAISWGVVASLTAFVPNFEWLVGARFLLGVAEAGFAPTVLLYLTIWYSNRERPKAFSIYLLGIPLSSVVAGPLATWLTQVGDGVFGLEGWRFMTLASGVPAVLLGVVVLFVLVDRPEQARWLSQEEQAVLEDDIAESSTADSDNHRGGMLSSMRSGKTWVLGVAYFGVVYGLYGIGFFLPSVIAGFEAANGEPLAPLQQGLLIAVPYAFAAIALILWPRDAARRNELGWHTLISTGVGATGILIAAFAQHPVLIMVGVTLCATGVISSMPLVYSLSARLLPAIAVGAGLALVNTIGNVGGFAGPFITGWLSDLFGNTQIAFVVLAGILVSAGVISVIVQRTSKVGVPNGDEFADTASAPDAVEQR
ncbi:MFS transporter [Agrococcus sp. ARC_14]|uniref:MFS transporter n=1 Tax=Agrococcus sp. ARC_14 TaxID=2919927 RepID=UPI001F065D91|nr:MFS transporter [Agrococcus sp. ARC_14]MCH1882249.1 MFS transporter [Agrococcus sp. ARC_14]